MPFGFGEYLVGGFGPDERFAAFVPAVDEAADRTDEVTGNQLTPTPDREVIYRCDCGAAWKHTLTDSEAHGLRQIA